MATTTTTVRIVPGRLTSLATAVRGNLNVVCSCSRLGDSESMELAIRQLRAKLTQLETEARLVCGEEE